jgi:hypothetical protein
MSRTAVEGNGRQMRSLKEEGEDCAIFRQFSTQNARVQALWVDGYTF